MNPIPNAEPAWKTYLRATVFLTPGFLTWLFSYILILPTLKVVWENAGVNSSRAEWVVDGSDFFMYQGRLIIAGVILLFVVLEISFPAWPRYRRVVISSVTIVLNTAVLVGMATLSTLATLAAKVLMKAP